MLLNKFLLEKVRESMYLVSTALNQANKYLFETWLPNHKLVTKPFMAEKYKEMDKKWLMIDLYVKNNTYYYFWISKAKKGTHCGCLSLLCSSLIPVSFSHLLLLFLRYAPGFDSPALPSRSHCCIDPNSSAGSVSPAAFYPYYHPGISMPE